MCYLSNDSFAKIGKFSFLCKPVLACMLFLRFLCEQFFSLFQKNFLMSQFQLIFPIPSSLEAEHPIFGKYFLSFSVKINVLL